MKNQDKYFRKTLPNSQARQEARELCASGVVEWLQKKFSGMLYPVSVPNQKETAHESH